MYRMCIVTVSELAIRSISLAIVSIDITHIIVGCHKGKVFVYSRDKSQQGCIVLTEFQAHDDYLLKCVISPDCSQLATTSADKTVKLWDTTTWKLKQRIKAHQKWVIIVTATFIEIYCFLFYPILSFLLCLFHSSLSKFCVGLGYCIFC